MNRLVVGDPEQDPPPKSVGKRSHGRTETLFGEVLLALDEESLAFIDQAPQRHLVEVVELEALARCTLFCDEWEQASHGGELTGAFEAGLVTRERVTELGEVLTGRSPGRPDEEAITLFDSTGLAIQDLAVCAALLEAHRRGEARPGWARL